MYFPSLKSLNIVIKYDESDEMNALESSISLANSYFKSSLVRFSMKFKGFADVDTPNNLYMSFLVVFEQFSNFSNWHLSRKSQN